MNRKEFLQMFLVGSGGLLLEKCSSSSPNGSQETDLVNQWITLQQFVNFTGRDDLSRRANHIAVGGYDDTLRNLDLNASYVVATYFRPLPYARQILDARNGPFSLRHAQLHVQFNKEGTTYVVDAVREYRLADKTYETKDGWTYVASDIDSTHTLLDNNNDALGDVKLAKFAIDVNGNQTSDPVTAWLESEAKVYKLQKSNTSQSYSDFPVW